MIEARPYLLYNKIQNYAWGARGEKAFIPSLLGIEAEPDIPYAELWLGAHPKASSEIMIGETRYGLNEIIAQFPEQMLGRECNSEFGNTLPYLFKVLSAGEPLSIQAHPSKEQAKILHAENPANYPDENHKPEIAIALDKLIALVGLKDFESLKTTIKHYHGFKEYVPAEIYNGFVNSDPSGVEDAAAHIKTFYSKVVRGSITDEKKFRSLIDALRQQIESGKQLQLPDQEQLFLDMHDKYGYDIGLISILLFNLVSLKSGQAIYTPAGLPHAYIGGNIIECMANSDNVIRAGLTPKYKDVDNLIELIDYTPGVPQLVKTKAVDHLTEYITPAREFRIQKIQLNREESVSLKNGQPVILLLLEGSAEISFQRGKLTIRRGESVFIPAMLPDFQVKAIHECTIFKSGLNRDQNC